MRRLILLISLAILGACGPGEAGVEDIDDGADAVSGEAELTGDSSDHDCRIVLRQLSRYELNGTAQQQCMGSTCWVVFAGDIDVAKSALSGTNPTVSALYATGTVWREAQASPVAGALAGFQRYRFFIGQYGVKTSAKLATTTTKIQIAPFLKVGNGRLFDHNRNAKDAANYVLSKSNAFAIAQDASCPASSGPRSSVSFDRSFKTLQQGALVKGGLLTVDYDLYRAGQCMGSTYNGSPAWDTQVNVRFQPGGQLYQGAVRGPQDSGGAWKSIPFEVAIPSDATKAEVWFLTSGRTCSSSYDSNYGNNYVFPVQAKSPAAVSWAGNYGGSFSRDCIHKDGLADPQVVDEYIRERACTFIDADVYVPGLTDAFEQHPELVIAQVELSFDGKAATYVTPQFVERNGNNYRYRFQLPRDVINTANWTTLGYAFRFSTDGIHWYRAGRGAGPSGGDARIVQRGF